jgi:hypothetical protein
MHELLEIQTTYANTNYHPKVLKILPCLATFAKLLNVAPKLRGKSLDSREELVEGLRSGPWFDEKHGWAAGWMG